MNEMKITVNGKTYDVKVGDVFSSPVEVVVDGSTYQVEVEAQSSVVAPVRTAVTRATPVTTAPAASTAAAPVAAASGNGVRAPMPGTIVKVEVKPGDKITRGQQMFLLEAMKMKNSIKSPVDAVVKAVHVTDGQKVQFNDMLVSFE
jgi:biotin carboxyl carrier protein